MEREILMQLDHPFILKLICAFQDDYFIYFLLELLIGGELFTFLRKHQRFSEPTMKIYAAGVVLGFEHMHSKKIAYRDLKPENLVLDKEGCLKIVDLGLAKVVHGKTWTLCGTPDYLAPEIILNEGHDKAVDYWALGVLMYELVAGVPPFYADDPMEVYEKILSGSMSFPSHFGKYLNDIVRKLLKLCQSKRLGNGKGGCGAIKKHRFFSGFGWEDLVTKKIKPPIEVKVADDADASNFDNYEEDKEEMPAMMKDWCWCSPECYSAAAGAELGAMLDALAGREAEVIMEELPPLLDASEVVAERLDAADAGSSTEDDEPCEPIMGWCHTCAASVRTRVDEETCEVECMRCSGTFVEILSQVLAGGQASAAASVQVLGAMRPLFATTIGAGGGGIALGDYAVGNLSDVIEQLVNADQARPKPASKERSRGSATSSTAATRRSPRAGTPRRAGASALPPLRDPPDAPAPESEDDLPPAAHE
ncbi:cGMP-dependent protein kinase [Aureococcus anophagefferens]|nr:cGMP-dependent protein kinase [Aureococcus anophagefferens]